MIGKYKNFKVYNVMIYFVYMLWDFAIVKLINTSPHVAIILYALWEHLRAMVFGNVKY
jgi:hypothetical protein